MFNVVLQWYCWLHVMSALRRVTATSKSQAQQYQGFFNGPQSVYQQQSMANIDSQKWHYSSNQQPAAYSWYWTSNDRPSASYFKNSLPSNRADQLASWACGRSQITSRFSRIMGGQDAAPHSYPWMVSLAKRSMNNLHLCGGVLVTRRHVITAAHCMEDFDGPNDLNILAGIHFTSEKNHPAPAMAITPHPQYEPETFANDIAVITLVSSLPENDPRISPICLPPDDMPSKSYPPLKVAGVAIGWGSTYFGGNPSVALKQVVLPILETTKWPCNVYVTYAYGQLCAGELRGGVDTCQADSGLSIFDDAST